MPTTIVAQPRRRALLAAALATPLAACGGGVPSTPQIAEFSADRSRYFVGERARLTVRYSGGAGRIEPGIGPVASGATVDTPALTDGIRYELRVDSPSGSASRALALEVGFRDRYVPLAAPFRAARHAAVLAGNGTVLLLGGSRFEPTLSYGIDRFDPATGDFVRLGLMQVGRELHRATALGDGRVLVTGGGAMAAEARTSELIDEASGHSTRVGDAHYGRSEHTATRLADGRVLLTGGAAAGTGMLITDTAEIFDPASGQFRLLAARLRSRRMAHTATLLADGRVLLAGGFSTGGAYFPAELFDPATETFTPVGAPLGLQRGLHAAQRLADGSVLIVGGEDFDPLRGTTTIVPAVQRFDPATAALAPAPDLAAARSAAAAIGLADDRILLFGGFDVTEAPAAAGEVYHRTGGSQALAPLAPARAWHSATRLADGRVLLVGGEDAAGNLVEQALLYE